MKTFIYKTVTFIGISITTIFLIFLLTNKLISINAKFKIAPVKNVIIGHSHSECAFNDSIINNFKNLSQSGQSYFYSYQKIKKVIAQNQNIKNVFVEFSNNQIDSSMNNWIWDDQSISSRSQYLPFLEKKDVELLLSKNPKGFILGSSKSFRNNSMNILLFQYNYSNKIGGYRWLDRSITDSLEKNTEKQDVANNQNAIPISQKNIEYLEKIVDVCRENKVNVYFIRSPQHVNLNSRKNEKDFMKIKNERFGDVEFLDFNDFPIENYEFADFGHLNHKGAKKFSVWFNNLLSNDLLSISNKSEYVASEINHLRTQNLSFSEKDKIIVEE